MKKYENLEIDDVHVFRNPNYKGFCIEWSDPAVGFGDINILLEDDGKVHVDGEHMSNDFIAAALSKIVPFMVRDDVKEYKYNV